MIVYPMAQWYEEPLGNSVNLIRIPRLNQPTITTTQETIRNIAINTKSSRYIDEDEEDQNKISVVNGLVNITLGTGVVGLVNVVGNVLRSTGRFETRMSDEFEGGWGRGGRISIPEALLNPFKGLREQYNDIEIHGGGRDPLSIHQEREALFNASILNAYIVNLSIQIQMSQIQLQNLQIQLQNLQRQLQNPIPGMGTLFIQGQIRMTENQIFQETMNLTLLGNQMASHNMQLAQEINTAANAVLLGTISSAANNFVNTISSPRQPLSQQILHQNSQRRESNLNQPAGTITSHFGELTISTNSREFMNTIRSTVETSIRERDEQIRSWNESSMASIRQTTSNTTQLIQNFRQSTSEFLYNIQHFTQHMRDRINVIRQHQSEASQALNQTLQNTRDLINHIHNHLATFVPQMPITTIEAVPNRWIQEPNRHNNLGRFIRTMSDAFAGNPFRPATVDTRGTLSANFASPFTAVGTVILDVGASVVNNIFDDITGTPLLNLERNPNNAIFMLDRVENASSDLLINQLLNDRTFQNVYATGVNRIADFITDSMRAIGNIGPNWIGATRNSTDPTFIDISAGVIRNVFNDLGNNVIDNFNVDIFRGLSNVVNTTVQYLDDSYRQPMLIAGRPAEIIRPTQTQSQFRPSATQMPILSLPSGNIGNNLSNPVLANSIIQATNVINLPTIPTGITPINVTKTTRELTRPNNSNLSIIEVSQPIRIEIEQRTKEQFIPFHRVRIDDWRRWLIGSDKHVFL